MTAVSSDLFNALFYYYLAKEKMTKPADLQTFTYCCIAIYKTHIIFLTTITKTFLKYIKETSS